jgi:hypothetical protein
MRGGVQQEPWMSPRRRDMLDRRFYKVEDLLRDMDHGADKGSDRAGKDAGAKGGSEDMPRSRRRQGPVGMLHTPDAWLLNSSFRMTC